VLRLLQAGHFKGVADVRLRINFHDEIAAAQAEAAKSAANEAVTELSGTVNARLEGLASSGELSEEQLAALGQLRDSFNESVATAAEAFLAAKQPTGEALTGSLDEAFDSLAGSLGAMLAANAVAQPEDAEPVSGAEAGPDLEAMLQALREAYAAAMVALNDALASKSFLPELSPDPGHGVAFAKFLAMYEQLQGPQEGEQADSQEPVDVQA
jgi:hypothetical protein